MPKIYNLGAYGLPVCQMVPLSNLYLTEHVKQRAAERAVPLTLLTAFDPVTCPVFQIETEDRAGTETVIRFNYRRRLDAEHNACVVIDPIGKKVVSVWVHHRSYRVAVDRSKYDRPQVGTVAVVAPSRY